MTSVLHRAQAAASDVFQTPLFPCYSPDYVQSQKGFSRIALWTYSKVYDASAFVNWGVRSGASALASAGDFAFGWAVRPILDLVYPVNHVNGHRHFVGIPRSVEKALGDWIFYPLAGGNMSSTHELIPGTSERIADRVESVMARLKNANAELLNPTGETPFDYRVKTVHSSQVNAFAVPAGGMVVFSQLVREIDGAIKSRAIRNSTVEFADGSTATVDLTGVTLEDTLAALMGHEMTHVASRHSIVGIFGNLIRTILLNVGRFVLLGSLKTSDKEYQELTQKPNLSASERATLAHKEQLYSRLNDFFAWIEEKFNHLTGLFHSRKNEYEADVTGAHFAKAAQFNPLGAIYLQEVLHQNKGGIMDAMHKHLEFLFTHPYGENRKRALFAAIQQIDPAALQGRTQWNIHNDPRYDLERSGPAMQFAHKTSR